MSAVTVKVTGGKEVQKNLDTLLQKRQKALVEVVEITQALVVNDAKALVPVKTGFLRNSINPGKVKVDLSSGTVDGEVTVDAEYASYVEFGTNRQKAQPYIVPAVMKNRNAFFRRLKEVLAA